MNIGLDNRTEYTADASLALLRWEVRCATVLISALVWFNMLERLHRNRMSCMTMKSRATFLAVLLPAIVFGPLSAQGGYGSAVGIVGDDIIVLKPTYGQGPGAALVYGRDVDGSWQVMDQLGAFAGTSNGEGLSPSIAVSGDMLFVAAADAGERWGAHVFRQNARRAWSNLESLELGTAPDGGEPEWNY